ncbi:hypothetical protein HID58_091059 [Brassica napus]|uniref:Uncharacterized protein n=1 Tax=Brassica napus TaxID=3708 RepID=A0ABQ7X8E3_BRANA|nr:hypothetical protein HID58_091059 [Brassica napus]
MPNKTITDFDYSVKRLRFLPDAQLLRDLPAIPRRPPRLRRARATQGPTKAPLLDFPNIPYIPMRDQRTIRAYSPAAAGRSRQRRDPSSESDDDATSEDTD